MLSGPIAERLGVGASVRWGSCDKKVRGRSVALSGRFFGLASSVVQRLLRDCYPPILHIMFDLPDAKRWVAFYTL